MVSKQAALRVTVPPELRDWVDNRLVSAHIRMVRALVLGTLLNAIVITAALVTEISSQLPALFLASTLAACLHRLWLAEGIERGRRIRRAGKMKLAFQLNSMWLGLTLGVCVAVHMPQVSPGIQLLLAIAAFGQIASAAYSVRTLPLAAMIYIAAQAMGLSLGLAQLGSRPAEGAILVVAVASALLVHMAHTAHDLFVTRIMSDRDLGTASRTVKLLLNAYEESGADWLFELDAQHRLVGVSRRFVEATGEGAETLNGRCLESLFAEDPGRGAIAAALRAGRPLRGEVVALDGTSAGEPRWWSISGRPSHAGDGVSYRGVISDVTEQRRAENRAHKMALFDALTELPNRANFNQTLGAMLAGRSGSEQLALLLLDIDHFKTINDMHGHPVGDSFLKAFARRLSHTVAMTGLGGTQPTIARLGSDEFAIAVSGGDACDHAVRLAELLVIALADPIEIDGLELPCTISLGIALAPHHTGQQGQLQSYADIALSAAKKGGRGTWEMFEPGMDEALHARHALARDLRHAIPRGELKLFLQPLVDVASEAKTGYEALLRWDHPVRGMVPPDTFIPIAEETGQIVQIGEWVIREAFAEAARWPGKETIAINLSPLQFACPNLLPVIVNALGDSGLEPGRVEFEITEGVLLHNSEANIDMLCRMQSLGLKIALDDFGTGYASLNYLLTFPFDKIKIDRSFVAGLSTREESRAIVASVITLANRLGMCTLAEGVEEREQLDALREQGCRMVQGWLFGKAEPSEVWHPAATLPEPRRRSATIGSIRSRHPSQTYSKRKRA
ncbi:EAL domain-containing protein [Novosphingobium sp.]|uniref:putative bifunctional diguanylate cyclase/phosphodiesterase n=1 Tax=Novosphingobium sp. TaxID=1874826 RepID=UPI00286CC39D|nr:EAL domain-containing protein [Novosphingobium sp.]